MRCHSVGGAFVRSALFLLVFFAVQIGPARAFGLSDLFGGGGIGNVVYDPTNHLETAVTAAQAVRQTALQVQAEIQRLQQLAVEVQQWRNLPDSVIQAGLRDWTGQLAVLGQGAATLATLGNQLQADQQRYADRLRTMAALGLSPDGWLAREAQSAAARQQAAASLFRAEQASVQSLQGAASQLAGLQAQIPASSGVHQSLQTTNQYLDLLVGQTSALLQLTANQAAMSHQQQLAQNADQSQADQREAQRVAGDLGRIKTLRASLRDSEARDGLGLMRPLP